MIFVRNLKFWEELVVPWLSPAIQRQHIAAVIEK